VDKRSRARAFAYPVASSPRARLDGARARFASIGARVEALTVGVARRAVAPTSASTRIRGRDVARDVARSRRV
jgi:hypothetical protein